MGKYAFALVSTTGLKKTFIEPKEPINNARAARAFGKSLANKSRQRCIVYLRDNYSIRVVSEHVSEQKK